MCNSAVVDVKAAMKRSAQAVLNSFINTIKMDFVAQSVADSQMKALVRRQKMKNREFTSFIRPDVVTRR